MTDLDYFSKRMEFSRKEIEELAKRLQSIPGLTEREQDLLVAVFAAARDRLTVPGEPPTPEHTSLADQILDVFVPDHEAMSGDDNVHIISFRIGTDPTHPHKVPPP